MTPPTTLSALCQHSIIALADELGRYVGAKRDLVHFIEYLSLAAGRMGIPIHLDVRSDEFALELGVADRILRLRPKNFTHVDTRAELRQFERRGFADLAVVVVRNGRHTVLRDATASVCRDVGAGDSLPSFWGFAPAERSLPTSPVTLRLMTNQINRDLAGFARAIAIPGHRSDPWGLGLLLGDLPVRPRYPRRFAYETPASMSPDAFVIFERMLSVFAALRITMQKEIDPVEAILAEDYLAARELLCSLPVVPADRTISPAALEMAEEIYRHIERTGHQLSIPDHSQTGHSWFARKHASAC